MSWRILYIENSDYLSLYLDNLKVTKEHDDTVIPLSDINSIIIDNYKTTISVNLLNKCMEYKVNVVLCDMQHLPYTIIYPYSINYQASLIQQQQLNWNSEHLGLIWKEIVIGKILNQANVLNYNNKSVDVINRLKKLSDEVIINDKTNREGLAAKMYFRELFGNKFTRDKDDNINSCLNYGYSIFRSLIARTLVAKGLNPHLGIFHKSQFNSFNLADDIIEVFRPIVDNFVYNNFSNDDYFTRDERIKLVELSSKKVIYKNQKQSISNVINSYIDSILLSLNTGEINNLSFPNIRTYDV